MKKIVFACISISLIVLVLQNCTKKVSTINLNVGKEYFPLQSGKTTIYKVDSTLFNDFDGSIEYKSGYIMDVIDTTFKDLLDSPTYYVKRYTKTDSQLNYTLQHVYYVTPYNNRIEEVFDNLRYIKLVFPITYLGTWGGNDYINTSSSKELYHWIGDKPYSYRDLGKPYNNDSLSFTNTLTVFQSNSLLGDTNKAEISKFGEFTYGVEKYAKGVGMVFKEVYYLKKDPSQTQGKGKQKGWRAIMQCVRHF
jgi:hypothetical protein